MSEECLRHPIVRIVLDAVDGYAMVLDDHRQILAANEELKEALELELPPCGVGMRPGELLGCIHAADGPGGCGTGRHCSVCGAVLAILAARAEDEPATGECRMTVRRDGELAAREFRVRVSPLPVNGCRLYVAVFQDSSDLSRRRCLERLFFHDVMNTLHGLEGWSEMFRAGRAEPRRVAERIVALSTRLTREVRSHRILLDAESGDLAVAPALLPVSAVLDELRVAADSLDAARGRTLSILPPEPGETVVTDPVLLGRVLLNMVVNALEATAPGGTVRCAFERRGDRPGFVVHNGAVIPEDTALRIFQRSFSTKEGEGRGLGAYGMKLIGERYLGGEVSFTSRAGEGTLFSFFLPPRCGGAN
jgi:signal transduction histidine kinase